jgi:predicted GNAT family N-acyltransferase
MRKFYDEIVPGRLKALVGKDNVRTIPGITQQRPLDVSLQGDRYYVVDADTDIAIPDHPGFRSLERAEQYLDELYSKSKSMDQIGFDITPEIREKFSKPIPYKKGGAVRISDNPDTMLLELMRAPRMQEGGSMDQFLGRTAPRGVSALHGYGQGKEDVQQVLTALEESPAGRIASGVGELAEGYMSGAGSTDLQKIGQGLSMIPMLGLPATVSKTIKTARVGDAITDSLRAKYPNVDISVAGDNTLYLGKMVVPKEQRNQGIGTQVMNDLVKQADDIGATVTLSPSADFGGNKEKLKEFYKRFGFVQNTGKNKDFAISESMYRTPQENLPTNFSDLGAMATQAYADYKANPNQLNALRYQRIKKAADDAYVKTQATPSKPVVTDEDYRGLHTAPTRASGAPLHALTQTYPDDIYSSRASQYYGHGEPRDAAVVSLAQSFKGRPHQMVTVYRAVPKNAKGGINAGDWVTIDRPYAKSHGESALRGDYKILSKRVRANEIFTNGDSIYEWGYDPVEAIKKAAGGVVNMQDNRKVRISDNPDTMRLELLRKKHA